MKNKAINIVGLYTQEQWDRLQERTKQLWDKLNEAHACLSTRAFSVKNMTYDGGSLSKEDKMAMIRTHADVMADMAGRCEAVLQSNDYFDVTQW